jgi:hypothetical protein
MKALIIAAVLSQTAAPSNEKVAAATQPAAQPHGVQQQAVPQLATPEQAAKPPVTQFPSKFLSFWDAKRQTIAYLEALSTTEVQYCWKENEAFKCFKFFHNGKAEPWGAAVPLPEQAKAPKLDNPPRS